MSADTVYLHAADIANVELCEECPLGNHRRGFYTPLPDTVHLRRERATKAALRRIWELAFEVDFDKPMTTQIYLRNLYIAWAAKSMKVRLPRHLADQDRARVRELLSKAPHSQRDEFYQTVTRWARR